MRARWVALKDLSENNNGKPYLHMFTYYAH